MTQENQHITLKYVLKEGTSSSYYRVDGPSGILPERLSITIGSKLTRTKNTGKARDAIGQVCGKHKKEEKGIYKSLNHGEIFSSIFRSPSNQNTTGYFILDERSYIFDLWVIDSTDHLKSFQLDLYKDQALNQKLIEDCFIEHRKKQALNL